MKFPTDNLRIVSSAKIITPERLIEKYPVTDKASGVIFKARQTIKNILSGEDKRLMVIVGPCSIHDPKSAIEYAHKLNKIRKELAKEVFIVMRVYFEKPRTTIGWKGLINDPDLDNSFHLDKGFSIARHLLLDLANMGLPAAVEYLDLITPQYVSDLLSWGSIGARTTESQSHRELASGLSCPVGFKNGTNGNIKIAVDAIISASSPHSFFSVSKKGRVKRYATSGNEDCHIILRGGKKPNYKKEDVDKVCEYLKAAGVYDKVMIDLSHGNSDKQYKKQINVGKDIANQIKNGSNKIFGVMIESHLKEGKQNIAPLEKLEYGISVTDACLSWEDTEKLLHILAAAKKNVL